MQTEHQLDLPRGLQVEFAQKVQAITDARGGELTADELMEAFDEHYLDRDTSRSSSSAYTHESGEEGDRLAARLRVDGEGVVVEGEGNGPIAALVHALEQRLGIEIHVLDYHEHAMSEARTRPRPPTSRRTSTTRSFWGVGIHSSIVTASLRAVVNAVNRASVLRAAREGAVAAFD